MANPIVDPSKVKYFPEMLIECINESSVTTTGQKVASYLMTDRRAVVENAEVYNQTANMDLVISADGIEKARIRSDSHTLRDPCRYHKLSAKETLDFSLIMTAGGPTSDVRSRWNITFRRPLAVDKIRDDVQLDTDELALSNDLHLDEHLSFGTIPHNQSLLNIDPAKLFDDVIPVERNMAIIAAGGESVIGGRKLDIPSPNSQLYVLLGVMVDQDLIVAGTADDTFLVVDRDNDPDYMKLDVSGMTDLQYVPCFVPCIKSLNVRIKSTSGTAAGGAGFIYGIRDLTVADHLRWNIPFNSPVARSDAQKLVTDNPKLAKSIQAGVI